MITKNRKMLALIIALVITLVSVSGTLIAVLVISNQSAQSTVHVKYTSTDVNVRVEAKYYVGTTGTDMVDKSNSNAKYLDLDANKTSGSLDQPSNEAVELSKTNNKIIYEYKFTNLSTTIPATIGQLVENGNVVVPKDSNNNVKLTYTSSSTSLGSGATSDATTLNTQGLPAGTTRYVYVIVSIVELLNDVDFSGSFGWDLAKGEAITSNTTAGSQSIVVDTTDVKLYNKSAMENIQLVVGVENTEPDYPMIEDKCFTGWYTDESLETKAVFPLTPTAETKLYPKYETATSDLTYVYNEASQSYFVGDGTTSYSGSTKNIVIPDTYNNGTNGLHAVTCINDCAFLKTSIISGIVIPGSVSNISIGDNRALKGGITTVSVSSANPVYKSENTCIVRKADNCLIYGGQKYDIPKYVTSIYDYACFGSYATTIALREGVVSIGRHAFYNNKFAELIIPSSVVNIDELAFSSCMHLKRVTFKEGLLSIGKEAFRGCVSLTSVTIPSTVTSLDRLAFINCTALNSFWVSDNNKVYKGESNCVMLRAEPTVLYCCFANGTIPAYITKIGDYAFYYNTARGSLHIPKSVTEIGVSAFESSSIKGSVVIPDSVITIGNSAFKSCNITSVTVGNGVKSIGVNAFYYCGNLTNITFNTITGWTVTNDSSATTGDPVTVSKSDTKANATLLRTTHASKYWHRA